MTKEIEVEGFGAFAEALEGIYNRPAIPETTGATTGDVLTLGSDGPEWAEVPKELPDTTGASTGDVLSLGASGPEWATPSGGVSYSTTEREVGTWLDGSTLYEKTYTYTASGQISSSFDMATLESGISVKGIEGTADEGGNVYAFPYVGANGSSSQINITPTKISISLYGTTWSDGTVFRATIRYIKISV